jgi:hypothetical protein
VLARVLAGYCYNLDYPEPPAAPARPAARFERQISMYCSSSLDQLLDQKFKTYR